MAASKFAQNEQKLSGWKSWGLVILVLILGSILTFKVLEPVKVLPRIDLSPGFIFRDQFGEKKTNEYYRGKITVINFAFTNCKESCAATYEKMSALQTALQASTSSYIQTMLITISLDPQRDQAEQLIAASEAYSLPKTVIYWDFLSGDVILTRYVVEGGFGLPYFNPAENGNEGVDYQIEFEPRFFLVDGWGIIRAEYNTDEFEVEQVMSDINLLNQEYQYSDGPGRMAYEAAHLFGCYP